jgi:homoaconitate hydratase
MNHALTAVERIATRFSPGRSEEYPVCSGEIVMIRPRHVMTHDNTGAVIPKFREIFRAAGLDAKMHDALQPVFAIDHDIQNVTPENLGKYAKIQAFAREHGIDFYPAGTGISHQVMVEQGYVTPGSMVVGSDSHSNLYGAIAALGTPVVRTDAASIWATGQTWWQVPPVARVTLNGSLRAGVTGKDLIVALCGLFRSDEVLNHAVEFAGVGVASLTVDQRMSVANMTTEWGALAGLFPFDEVLRDYLIKRSDVLAKGSRPGVRPRGDAPPYTVQQIEKWWSERDRTEADPDAVYAAELEIDLSTIVPHVSGPNNVKTMHSLPAIQSRRVAINKAWLMSCVNGRLEDISAAAAVVKGRKVAPGVEFYLAAASAEIQQQAIERGEWQQLVDAGAIVLPPGCGTCIGLGAGTIKAGEVGISSTNRNFEGRMGDRKGEVYLGSPAVVAESAIAGYIKSPTVYGDQKPMGTYRRGAVAASAAGKTSVIAGFPASVKGRAWLLNRDNINTDAIYAGKHTYNDAMKPDEMAKVIFENLDPSLAARMQAGDIVVGGLNFGTGSSREQAATALKFAGISCVIASSFSETYKRNAFNNGFIAMECPALVEALRGGAETTKPHAVVGLCGELAIDFASSKVAWTDAEGSAAEFAFAPLSQVAQELIVAGGGEAMTVARLRAL